MSLAAMPWPYRLSKALALQTYATRSCDEMDLVMIVHQVPWLNKAVELRSSGELVKIHLADHSLWFLLFCKWLIPANDHGDDCIVVILILAVWNRLDSPYSSKLMVKRGRQFLIQLVTW